MSNTTPAPLPDTIIPPVILPRESFQGCDQRDQLARELARKRIEVLKSAARSRRAVAYAKGEAGEVADQRWLDSRVYGAGTYLTALITSLLLPSLFDPYRKPAPAESLHDLAQAWLRGDETDAQRERLDSWLSSFARHRWEAYDAEGFELDTNGYARRWRLAHDVTEALGTSLDSADWPRNFAASLDLLNRHLGHVDHHTQSRLDAIEDLAARVDTLERFSEDHDIQDEVDLRTEASILDRLAAIEKHLTLPHPKTATEQN